MLIIAHFQRYRRCCKSFLSERFLFIESTFLFKKKNETAPSDYYIKKVDKSAFTVYNKNRIYVPIEARGNSPRE